MLNTFVWLSYSHVKFNTYSTQMRTHKLNSNLCSQSVYIVLYCMLGQFKRDLLTHMNGPALRGCVYYMRATPLRLWPPIVIGRHQRTAWMADETETIYYVGTRDGNKVRNYTVVTFTQNRSPQHVGMRTERSKKRCDGYKQHPKRCGTQALWRVIDDHFMVTAYALATCIALKFLGRTFIREICPLAYCTELHHSFSFT
jgi:hypothetical protein